MISLDTISYKPVRSHHYHVRVEPKVEVEVDVNDFEYGKERKPAEKVKPYKPNNKLLNAVYLVIKNEKTIRRTDIIKKSGVSATAIDKYIEILMKSRKIYKRRVSRIGVKIAYGYCPKKS